MNKKYKILIGLSIIIIGLASIYFYSRGEKVYTLKKYYPDTKQTDISQYVIRNGDTVFHGKYISYNEKGNKISEVNFVDGDIKGKCIYYFNNGQIESIQFKTNSKITQEGIWNNPNGKIRQYALYNPAGECIFTVYYDKDGVVGSYNGHPQIEVYQYKFSHKKQFNIKTDQYLKIGDILKYKYVIANIPNAKRSFKIENLNIDNSKVKRTLKQVLPAQIDVEEALTKKGKNTIRSIVSYEFNDSITPILKDTLSFDVNVN